MEHVSSLRNLRLCVVLLVLLWLMPTASAFDRSGLCQTGKGTDRSPHFDSSTQGGWQVHYVLDVKTSMKHSKGLPFSYAKFSLCCKWDKLEGIWENPYSLLLLPKTHQVNFSDPHHVAITFPSQVIIHVDRQRWNIYEATGWKTEGSRFHSGRWWEIFLLQCP
jgi:hypothetical protein